MSERRFFRRLEKTEERIRSEVNPTVLPAEDIDLQVSHKNFYLVPKGTEVLVELTTVSSFRRRRKSTILGKAILTKDTECEFFGCSPEPMNQNAPPDSVTVAFGLSSDKVRGLNARDKKIEDLLGDLWTGGGFKDKVKANQLHNELDANQSKKEAETAALSQLFLARNDEMIKRLKDVGVQSHDVREVRFIAAATRPVPPTSSSPNAT